MKNKIFILSIIMIIPAISFGQEIITRLSTNPAIKAYHNNMKAKTSKKVMLSIPFFDDFSCWVGSFVIVFFSFSSFFSVDRATASFDLDRFKMDEGVGNFDAGGGKDPRDRGTMDLHLECNGVLV